MEASIRSRKPTELPAHVPRTRTAHGDAPPIPDRQAVSDNGADFQAAAPLDFAMAFRAEPMARIEMIKRGVPATTVVEMAAQMGISKEQLLRTLGLARATIDRKVRELSLLSAEESSRVFGLSRLVGRVQALVDDAGSATDFNAARWTATWLEQPLPALGGRRPAELMDTAEGQEVVFHLVGQIGSGAYA